MPTWRMRAAGGSVGRVMADRPLASARRALYTAWGPPSGAVSLAAGAMAAPATPTAGAASAPATFDVPWTALVCSGMDAPAAASEARPSGGGDARKLAQSPWAGRAWQLGGPLIEKPRPAVLGGLVLNAPAKRPRASAESPPAMPGALQLQVKAAVPFDPRRLGWSWRHFSCSRGMIYGQRCREEHVALTLSFPRVV